MAITIQHVIIIQSSKRPKTFLIRDHAAAFLGMISSPLMMKPSIQGDQSIHLNDKSLIVGKKGHFLGLPTLQPCTQTRLKGDTAFHSILYNYRKSLQSQSKQSSILHQHSSTLTIQMQQIPVKMNINPRHQHFEELVVSETR